MLRKSLNETQKNILSGLMYAIFAELREKEPEFALNILSLIKLSPQHRQVQDQYHISDTDLKDWVETINQIANIYQHPCPQNRSENYPYFEAPRDPGLIVYKNAEDKPAFEQQGLLGLTARNDGTADPVTKEALLEYLNELISTEANHHRQKFLACTLSTESLNQLYAANINGGNPTTLEIDEFISSRENFASLTAFLNLHPEITNLIINNSVSYIGIAALAIFTKLKVIVANCTVYASDNPTPILNFSPINLAMMYGDEVAVKALLPTIQPRPTLSAQLAIFAGFLFILKQYIASGVAIDECDESNVTLLMIAAMASDPSAAEFCLANHANHALTEASGMTALHIAALNGNTRVVELLLDHGAELECQTASGETALALAAQHTRATEGHNTVSLLLKRGANVKPALANSKKLCVAAVLHELYCVIDALGKEHVLDHRYGDNEETLLHVALAADKRISFAALVAAGANINASNKSGQTPLYAAVAKNDSQMTLTCLLREDIDVDIADNNGVTPLHLAAGQRQSNTLKFLLGGGKHANLEASTNTGRTPLMLAVLNQLHENVVTLLSYDAQTDSKDHAGCTALYYAAENGLLDITQRLLEKHANPTICSNTGESPRAAALRNQHFAVVNAIDIAINALQNPARRFITARMNGSIFNASAAKKIESDFIIVVLNDICALGTLSNFLSLYADQLSQSVLDRSLRIAAANNRAKNIAILLQQTKANPQATGKHSGKSALHFAFQFDHFDCAYELLQHFAVTNKHDCIITQLCMKDSITGATPLDIFSDHIMRDLNVNPLHANCVGNITSLQKLMKSVTKHAKPSGELVAQCELINSKLLALLNLAIGEIDAGNVHHQGNLRKVQ